MWKRCGYLRVETGLPSYTSPIILLYNLGEKQYFWVSKTII